MRKEVFEEDNFYHIYCRGTEKRNIFLDDRDRVRFINTFYVLNNFIVPGHFNFVDLHPRESLTPINPYVEVSAGCLMDTHYHLMLTPLKKNGISQLMQKVGTSYTKYVNKRRERTGRLFESTFKAKHIDGHEYAEYLTQYIHLNPKELFQAKSKTELFEKIIKYPWSSLPIYLGKESRFSLLVSSAFRDEVLGVTAEEYRKFLAEVYNGLS